MSDRKYIILALLYVLLLFPGQYILKAAFTPENSIMVIDNDMTFLGVIKSLLWGLQTPWPDPDVSIFTDVALGSAMGILPLIIVWFMTGGDPWHIMIFINTAFTFGYLIVIFYVMKRLLPGGEWKFAFPILLFANGIGGLLFFPMEAVTDFTAAGLNNLFWGWMTSPSIYQILSLLTGYLGFYYFTKQNDMRSKIFLSLTFLAYPTGGILFSGMFLIYGGLRKDIKYSLKTVGFAMLFLLPWLYSISLNVIPYERVAEFYSTPISYPDRFIFTFLVNSGLALLFAAYAFIERKNIVNSNKQFLFIWTFLLIVAVLSQLLVKKMDVSKFFVMYWIPLSMLAGIGIKRFSEKYDVSYKYIFAAVMILSIPSFFMFYTQTGINNETYLSSDIEEALLFLRDQDQGLVLAPNELGRYIPYYSEKRSLTGGPLPGESIQAYEEFFVNPEEIIDRYGIDYIIIQNKEVPDIDLDEIYSGSLKIYKVA